ncbi:MAG: hypothetical protein M0005_01550 [Actinomycetota bacterium]|nr:hypothetical protein [Actinomycetota bacterium]
MTVVTCPACGLSFETAATTNTRCRRCRKVVNIGPLVEAVVPRGRTTAAGTRTRHQQALAGS